MKLTTLFAALLVILSISSLAHADSSSRGALWGGIGGAAVGGSVGGPTGAILGGLGGAAVGSSIGASRNRHHYEYVDQYGRPVEVRRVYRRPVRRVVTRRVITQPVQKVIVTPREEVIYIN